MGTLTGIYGDSQWKRRGPPVEFNGDLQWKKTLIYLQNGVLTDVYSGSRM